MKKFSKVVLVDDNETTNFYNEDVLLESDLFDEIIVMTSGTEAIDYFSMIKNESLPLPDLMFLDIKIPDYEGFEILEHLEEIWEDELDNVIICMLTTSKHKRDLEKFDKFISAVEFLEKPLLLSKVHEIVAKYFPNR